MPKPRIVVFSGPTATIGNSPPLVTGNQARARHGLPLLTDADGAPLEHDLLRPQRLAAPVTVYIEAFSAHPLEPDSAELCGPPDGWLDADGTFSDGRRGRLPGHLRYASTPIFPENTPIVLGGSRLLTG